MWKAPNYPNVCPIKQNKKKGTCKITWYPKMATPLQKKKSPHAHTYSILPTPKKVCEFWENLLLLSIPVLCSMFSLDMTKGGRNAPFRKGQFVDSLCMWKISRFITFSVLANQDVTFFQSSCQKLQFSPLRRNYPTIGNFWPHFFLKDKNAHLYLFTFCCPFPLKKP